VLLFEKVFSKSESTKLKQFLKTKKYNCFFYKKHRPQMEAALLKYFAENSVPKEFPHLWEPLRDVLEDVLVVQWSEAKACGRDEFVAGNRAACNCFLPAEALDTVLQALRAEKEPPLDIMVQLTSSQFGGALFSDQKAKIAWMQFTKAATDGLEVLVHHSYDPAEVASYERVMKFHMKKLLAGGCARFDRKTQVLPFLGESALTHSIRDTNDEWSFRLESAKVSLAVSNGGLVRLPWEKLVYGESQEKIDGVMETITVAESLLTKQKNVRAAALKILGPHADELPLHEMQSLMKKKQGGPREHVSGVGGRSHVPYELRGTGALAGD